MNTNFNTEDLAKIKHLVDMGVTTKQEVKDINDSYRETFSDVCVDLDLDKRVMRKAVTVAFKASQKSGKEEIIVETQEELDEVSHILDAIGIK